MPIGAARRFPRAGREVLQLALVALSYFIAARLSLNLALVHGQVTPIWPPTGIAVVALLLLGRRAAVPIALAAFAVNLPIGPSPLGAVVISVGNTLAPLLAVEVLRRMDFHFWLDRLRDAVQLIAIGALGAMTISATVGTLVLLASGSIASTSFWATWAVWWTGDAMGVLLVAPFLLCLLSRGALSGLRGAAGAQLAALLAATAIVAYLLFQSELGIEYLVLPLIMLIAWRFRLRGAAPAALIASGVAIWAAIHHTGPFNGETLLENMVTLQVFNVSVALASFLLSMYVDRRERQEEMSRLYSSATAANEAKTQFLHMAAHELRTPISVVSGYLAMLSDGSLGAAPAAWRRPLEVLTGKARELNSIVTDLLEASRIDARALPLTTEVIDLRTVVEQAGERARPRANLLGAEVLVRVPEEPVMVQADAQQLARILDNLVNNGLTYTTRAARVSLAMTSEGGKALVRVEDNGAGIPEQERERVFERFHRTNDPAFRMVAGTGLGLFIARQLAERHGGSLVVESSRVGEGTVFTMALPLAAAERITSISQVDPGPGVEKLVTIS